eukprot:6516004-Karenia_brevis.AAC.1
MSTCQHSVDARHAARNDSAIALSIAAIKALTTFILHIACIGGPEPRSTWSACGNARSRPCREHCRSSSS